jgi:hypothetical protein
MGKKLGNAGPSSASRSTNQAVSLREETSGKTQVDSASLLRAQHLQRLAAWASGEAAVGPIGALLGHRLATGAEAAGIPIGASTFLCQRLELCSLLYSSNRSILVSNCYDVLTP